MWKERLFSIAVLLATPAMALVEPAAAREQQQSATSALPSNERLDALVAAKRWNDLADVMAQAQGEDFVRKIDWLKAKIDAGGGLPLVLAYTQSLWDLGRSNPAADPDKDLRVTAAFMLLYSYALIGVDGAKCEDHSAPGHRLDQVLDMDAPILKFLKTRPQKLKDKLIAGVIGYEKFTAPLRKDDDVLCRGGLHEMMAGFESGTVHQEPTTSGQGGQSYAVEAPPSYAPQFLPAAEYVPLQEKARATLKANLTQMVESIPTKKR
jgi:hypothetical protein